MVEWCRSRELRVVLFDGGAERASERDVMVRALTLMHRQGRRSTPSLPPNNARKLSWEAGSATGSGEVNCLWYLFYSSTSVITAQ